MAPVGFVIYGGCVSRDVFDASDRLKARAKILKYYSRSVPASYATAPFAFPAVISGTGKFQTRLMREDAGKSFADFLRAPPAFDIMLCDFVTAARQDLYELPSGEIGTLTLQVQKLFENRVEYRRIERTSQACRDLHRQGMALFLDFARALAPDRQVMVNKVYLSNRQSDGSLGTANIDAPNALLDDIYAEIAAALGERVFLTFEPGDLICDLNHKWTPAPFHYVQQFYHRQAAQILSRLGPAGPEVPACPPAPGLQPDG